MPEGPDGAAVLKSIGLWGGASALGVGLAAGAVGVSAAAAVGGLDRGRHRIADPGAYLQDRLAG